MLRSKKMCTDTNNNSETATKSISDHPVLWASWLLHLEQIFQNTAGSKIIHLKEVSRGNKLWPSNLDPIGELTNIDSRAHVGLASSDHWVRDSTQQSQFL